MNQLQKLFLISIALFYLHGLEEILTGFYHADPTIQWFARQFQSIDQAVYYVFHFWWWLILPVAFLLLKGGRAAYTVLAVYGFVLLYESGHFLRAFTEGHYFPGMVTALFFPVIGYFYWRELIKNFKGFKAR